MRACAVYQPLRRRDDFRRVHAQGQRKGDDLIQVRALPTPTAVPVSAPLRLGIIASKKYGSAVERNRFKRIVRAAVHALGQEITPGWDILILPRAVHQAKMQDIAISLRRLLGYLGILRTNDISEGGGALSDAST